MKKIQLRIKVSGCIRSAHSRVSNEEVQRILTLLDGAVVEANVYSSTNICFQITEKMIRHAWDIFGDSDRYWINEGHVEKIIERFTERNEYGNTLSCTLPNLYCESTPAEIDEMLKA